MCLWVAAAVCALFHAHILHLDFYMLLPVSQGAASEESTVHCLTWPQSPVTQRAGGQRPKLQRMRVGGLLVYEHCAADNVLERSLLLHRTIRCLNPEPHLGVHWKENKY